jgi:hypothetical protein
VGYGSTVLFSKYVITPSTAEEARTHMHEMALAGFPGCPCSTDATHISMDRCSNSLQNLHKIPKLHLPARTYNLSSNHRRFILYTTSGHPSKWNDKTLQIFDGFMKSIHDGSLMGDVIFELDDKDKEGNDIKVKYKGAWQIVDNGYMPWSTCVPPLKHNYYSADQRWSWWVESMQKDVECTFGILKGILKSPIQVHGVEKVDMIWKTCCGLHNLLLEIDGCGEEWTSHVHSDLWCEFDEEPPFAIQRLKINQPSFAKFDFSGMGLGSDFNIGVDGCEDSALTACTGLNEINIHEINIVSQLLSLDTFRRKLIKHFDIKYKRNEIVWPKQKPIVML